MRRRARHRGSLVQRGRRETRRYRGRVTFGHSLLAEDSEGNDEENFCTEVRVVPTALHLSAFRDDKISCASISSSLFERNASKAVWSRPHFWRQLFIPSFSARQLNTVIMPCSWRHTQYRATSSSHTCKHDFCHSDQMRCGRRCCGGSVSGACGVKAARVRVHSTTHGRRRARSTHVFNRVRALQPRRARPFLRL